MSTTTAYFVEAEDSRESVELFATAAHPDAVCSSSLFSNIRLAILSTCRYLKRVSVAVIEIPNPVFQPCFLYRLYKVL